MYSKDIASVSWIDLTVQNAEQVKDFYSRTVGLRPQALSMQGYDDYVMSSPDNDNDHVGICHARGPNADLPPQWLIYFNVADIDNALQECKSLGGEIVRDKQDMGDHYMCIIKDPAGAVAGLICKK